MQSFKETLKQTLKSFGRFDLFFTAIVVIFYAVMAFAHGNLSEESVINFSVFGHSFFVLKLVRWQFYLYDVIMSSFLVMILALLVSFAVYFWTKKNLDLNVYESLVVWMVVIIFSFQWSVVSVSGVVIVVAIGFLTGFSISVLRYYINKLFVFLKTQII